MAISVVCEACGKRFGAPDAFAGKQVKCRGCGATLTIPGGEPELGFQGDGGAAPADDIFGSTASTAVAEPASDDTGTGMKSLDASRPGDDRHEEPVAPPRERKLRAFYGNPYVRMVDQWLPLASCVVGLLWMSLSISGQTYVPAHTGTSQAIPGWTATTRIGIVALLYLGLMFPLTLMGMKVAAKSINLPLPSNTRWKLFASYVPSVCLAIAIWNAGGGATPALVVGAILGLIVSSAFMTILFRLEIEEIALVAGHTGGGFFLGAVLTGLALYGINLVTILVLTSSKVPNPPPTSPYWSGFEWEAKYDDMRKGAPAAPTTKKPASKPAPVNGNAKPPETPSDAGKTPVGPTPPKPKSTKETKIEKAMLMTVPGADDVVPLVAADSRKFLDEVGDAFDSAIRPITVSPVVAIVRKAPRDAFAFEARDERTMVPIRSRPFEVTPDTTVPLHDLFAVSPDGQSFAYFQGFPTIGVHVRTAEGADREVAPVDDSQQKSYKLIGFAGNNRLLWRYDTREKTVIQIVDLAGRGVRSIELQFQLDASGSSNAIDPTGRLLAIADNAKNIVVYDIAAGLNVGDPIAFGPVKTSSTETAPSGLAFSPDSSCVAAYFDFGQRSILRSFRVDTHVKNAELAFQSNPVPRDQQREFTGNVLAWWPNGKGWVIYGDAVFDAANGLIGRIALQNVTSQKFVDDRNLDIVAMSPEDKKRRLIRVTLDVVGH